MPGLEFIERLASGYIEERWLVRAGGREEPQIAWVLREEDREWLEQVERETRAWLGPLHPRVAQISEISWFGQALAFLVDDDRGPFFMEAAAQLTDPIERERWSVAQIIAIGDGLAAMRQRDRSFVHRRLGPSQLFVDSAGHARLHAPVAMVTQGPLRTYSGFGRPFSRTEMATMSPEQVRGLELTPASDVFALAGSLFAALTGQSLFRRDDELRTLQAIIGEETPPIAAHAPGLAAVIARAFDKDPDRRYPDPGTFAGELWRCVPDAAEYDECISDRIAAWWPTTAMRERPPVERAAGRCRMAWEQLSPTGSDDVRRCGSCRQDVVRVTSIAAVVPLLGQRCISYRGER